MITFNLFDTLLEPTFVIDQNLKIVYCNETAALMTGLSIRKLSKGLFINEVLLFEEKLECFYNITKYNDEASPYKEVKFKAPHLESEGKVQITVQPIRSSVEQTQWIVFIRDVTLEERLQKKYHAELDAKEDVIVELQKAKQELENYSKNLEKMVEERTTEIRALNRQMQALLDSLNQGFFMFNSQGIVQSVSSKACETTIEQMPQGQNITRVLKLKDKEIDGFNKWMLTVFSEMLAFEDLAPLGPPSFPHKDQKKISLQYFPLRDENQIIENIVVVASDITDLVAAQEQAEKQKSRAEMILNIFQRKKEIQRYLSETTALVKELESMLAQNSLTWDLEMIFRLLHTIKGASAIYSFNHLAHLCHQAENQFQEYRYMTADDHLKNIFVKSTLSCIEEFAKIKAEIEMYIGSSETSTMKIEVQRQDLESLINLTRRLKNINSVTGISSLIDSIEKINNRYFKTDLKEVLASYNELIQKTSHHLGKKVSPLKITGSDILIPPGVYDRLLNSFVHAFRNSLDHGIETPEIRITKNKTEESTINVRINRFNKNQSSYLLIEIQDDGAGISPQVIRKKCSEKNILHENLTDYQVVQKVFDASFSTKEEVSDLSGRGVGMDAIQYEAKSLGGRCWVKSRLEKGTSLFVFVPWLESEVQSHSLKKAA